MKKGESDEKNRKNSISSLCYYNITIGTWTRVVDVPFYYHLSTPSNSKKPQMPKSLQFIKDNREVLEVEVAKGEGETLDTLATLYDEVNEENKEMWKSKLQENYEQIFHPDGGVAADEYVDYMFRSLIASR